MLQKILAELQAKNVTLVAVSKTKPVEAIAEMYAKGQRIFGENRALELRDKEAELPKDIDWHMIGHLQTNKIKYIAPFVHTIHSVDSEKLLEEINKRAAQNDRTINCLLQFHIAEESTKTGLSLAEGIALLEKGLSHYPNLKIVGVMGMATFTDDLVVVRKEFRSLKNIFDKLQAQFFENQADFKEISMGMSGDYQIAVEEGSTMVRIGSLLFGSR